MVGFIYIGLCLREHNVGLVRTQLIFVKRKDTLQFRVSRDVLKFLTSAVLYLYSVIIIHL